MLHGRESVQRPLICAQESTPTAAGQSDSCVGLDMMLNVGPGVGGGVGLGVGLCVGLGVGPGVVGWGLVS